MRPRSHLLSERLVRKCTLSHADMPRTELNRNRSHSFSREKENILWLRRRHYLFSSYCLVSSSILNQINDAIDLKDFPVLKCLNGCVFELCNTKRRKGECTESQMRKNVDWPMFSRLVFRKGWANVHQYFFFVSSRPDISDSNKSWPVHCLRSSECRLFGIRVSLVNETTRFRSWTNTFRPLDVART